MKRHIHGKIRMTADLGREFSVPDSDGRVVPAMLSLKWILQAAGRDTLASWTPSWIRVQIVRQ